MDNQHEHIHGYRNLPQADIDRMNAVKALADHCGSMVEELRRTPGIDLRWVSIAQTHLQQGFMAAVRSIARPTSF